MDTHASNQMSQAISDLGKLYVKPSDTHISLGRTLRGVLFFFPFAVYALFMIGGIKTGALSEPIGVILVIAGAVFWYVVISGVRIAAQWEQGVVLRLGKFVDKRGPGLFYVIPIIEYVRFIDTRTLVLNIPRQKVITKDNVPAEIDSALFFMVTDPERAVVAIQDFRFAIAQYAQAALRDVIGALSLDELLSEREQIQAQIAKNVETHIKAWGMHMDSVRLQDIELPEDLKRMMSRQASAEREKRATITKAEGDKLAAENLTAAAVTMSQNPLAFQLRTLQTLDGLGASPSNTVVLFPIELVDALRTIGKA